MALKIDQALRQKQVEAAAEWAPFLGSLDETQKAVLKKYTIIEESSGEPTVVALEDPKSPMDDGIPAVKLSLDACQRLVKADTTPDHRWTDWIFYQSGGGDDGKRGSAEALETVKRRFIDERTKGYPHPRKKTFVPGISRQEAEAKWEKNLPEVRKIIDIGDENSVQRLHCFGYYQAWPGYDSRYQKVTAAVTEFLGLYKKALAMNKEIVREGQTAINTEPSQFPNVTDLVAVTKKITKYYASKQARDDIRVDVIYDDDVIDAVAPLTYAAAVRYGFDDWAWASREKFERVLQSDDSWNDEWKKGTDKGTVYVYLTFKVPTPSWITRRDGNFQRRFLEHLAIVLNASSLKSINRDAIVCHDEENNEQRTVGAIRDMLMAEPTRQNSPEEEEWPFKRGANVYKTTQEAEEVVKHFDAAIDAVVKWAAEFDPKKIKGKVLDYAA